MHSFKRIIIIIIIPRQKKPGASQSRAGMRYNFYFDWTQCLRSGARADACQMMGR